MPSESRPPGIRRLLRLPGRARRVDHEAADEIRFHFESRIADLMARGMSSAEARRLAAREFGDPIAAHRELVRMDRRAQRRERRTAWREDLAMDVRLACRSMARSPTFTLVVVATLAIGIGANATMFGVLDRLLLRPPSHVTEPGELATLLVERTSSGRVTRQSSFGYGTFRDITAAGVFPRVASFAGSQIASLGSGPRAEKARIQLVSAGFFTTLGTRPRLGRFFQADEDRPPGGQPVMVISHAFWQRRFAGDPGAIGQALPVGQRTFTIIGVAPPDFAGLGLAAIDAWIPISAGTGLRFIDFPGWDTDRASSWLRIVVRKPAGDSALLAATATLAFRPTLAAPRDSNAVVSLSSVLRRQTATQSPNARIAKLLAAVSACVLLIACANTANLLLARGIRRRRELATRRALGADRRRLVRLLLVEVAGFTICGAVGALLVARWGGDVVRRQFLAGDTVWPVALFDVRVLGFTALVAIGTVLITGLSPAWRLSQPDLVRHLRSGTREHGGPHGGVRNVLLVTQGMLSVVLLVGTVLLLRSLSNVNGLRLGLELEQVVLVSMDLEAAAYAPEDAARTYERLAERARAIPGVQNAALTLGVPFLSFFGTELRLPGRDSLPRPSDGSPPAFEAIDERYFATLGIPLRRGRNFSRTEIVTAGRVVLVNEAMARLYWPGEEPLGQCLQIGGDTMPCSTVIGVTANAHRESLMQEHPTLQFYTPLGTEAAANRGERTLLLRVPRQDARMRETIRRELQGAAPSLPFAEVRPMRDLLAAEFRPWELGATMFSVFASLALLLAAIGWYASLAYDVGQRVPEIGVRMALGANPARLMSFFIWRGTRVTLIAAALGMTLAALLMPWLREFLVGVSPTDPWVWTVVLAVVLGTSFVATLIPARRAARIDPAVALRADG